NLALLEDDGGYYITESFACNDDRPYNAEFYDPEGRSVYDEASYLRFTSLPAGTYEIDLRGYGPGDDGTFQLRVRNESAPGSLVDRKGVGQGRRVESG